MLTIGKTIATSGGFLLVANEWEILEKRLNEIVGMRPAAPAFAPAPARTAEEEARAEAEEYYYQLLAEKEREARSQVLPSDTDVDTPKMA